MGVDLVIVTYSGMIKLETGNESSVWTQGSDAFTFLGLTCLGLTPGESVLTFRDTWGEKMIFLTGRSEETTFYVPNTKSLAMQPLRTTIYRSCYELIGACTAHIPGPSLSSFEK